MVHKRELYEATLFITIANQLLLTSPATIYLQQHPDTLTRFDKVAELVEGFESPFGLELLSTVHWIIKYESVSSVDEVLTHTYAWSDRKRRFAPRQIALATNVLSDKGWVEKLSIVEPAV